MEKSVLSEFNFYFSPSKVSLSATGTSGQIAAITAMLIVLYGVLHIAV